MNLNAKEDPACTKILDGDERAGDAITDSDAGVQAELA